MCEPTLLIGAGISAAGMMANSRAQNSAARQAQGILNEQVKVSAEQFDSRQATARASDDRIRELEQQGFDRTDAVRQAYIERVGTILEDEARRTTKMRNQQDALIGTALEEGGFDAFASRLGNVAGGLDQDVAARVEDRVAVPESSTLNPETQKAMLREEAARTAKTLGREGAANRLAGADIALSSLGDAVENLRLGSGLVRAKFDAGNMLNSQLQAAEAPGKAIMPELKFLDRSIGIKADRTQGAIAGSQTFENNMGRLAQSRAAGVRPDTRIGDLLGAIGGGVSSYGAGGGSFFAPKPTPVRTYSAPPGGYSYGGGLY